ncbi:MULTISPECIES: type II toxin-antitoxin system RelE/ParE family toxin [unclassified Frankia]|uniref:type II toxin-antitoxin system RelE family toxin n=1 Tax=unclassified Frankia TaxID=2632575 RepID=UPI001EF6233D|nr:MULTISPECIES: type II toxin-antitoxin system RelE/ParE family toxin [unclassified Frankia]
MSEASEPFELLITGPTARALAGRLPEKIAVAVHEFITTTLLDNPHRLGKRLLLPPYEGTWSARRGSYRVLYNIDEENRTVTVTAVEHRSDAYRSR